MRADRWRRRFAVVRTTLALEISTIRSGRRGWTDFGSIMFDVSRTLRDQERAADIFSGTDGKTRLLFWSAKSPPQRYIRPEVPPADRTALIDALRGGRKVAYFMGWARCRICAKPLGTADMLVCEMVYPERADHYLSEHDVWTPECDELLRRLRMRSIR